jgi:hypothetical protein
MIGQCGFTFSTIAAFAARAILDSSMVKRIFVAVPILIASILTFCLNSPGEPSAESGRKSFVVYDNMVGNKNRPDVQESGLENCNIIYGDGNQKIESTTSEETFKALVTARAKKPGPIVIDIEKLPLAGAAADVQPHFQLFLKLVRWAHEAAPGRVIGYYGEAAGLFPAKVGKAYQADAKKLADVVDAFFPSMYVSSDDRDLWNSKARKLLADAHAMEPGKPVYFYLMPYYHEGSPKAGQYIDGDFWSFQLKQSQQLGADGAVIWMASKLPWTPAEWWPATLKFVDGMKQP